MENLDMKQKGPLPGISFDAKSGKFEIKGQSSPTNAYIFYKPVINWLDEYMNDPCETTTLEIFLNYFNTISSKAIFEILKKLQEISKTGKKVLIRWCYDEGDYDLEEAGTDFASIIDLPFEMVAVEA